MTFGHIEVIKVLDADLCDDSKVINNKISRLNARTLAIQQQFQELQAFAALLLNVQRSDTVRQSSILQISNVLWIQKWTEQ